MSEWSRKADWEKYLRETIKIGDLPGTKFAEECGIPFGAWFEMANKSNRIGKEKTIEWAIESLEKLSKEKKEKEEQSFEKDQELCEKYTIVTNLGFSQSAYYIATPKGKEEEKILRWGEQALTFKSKEEAMRFAGEVFPSTDEYRIAEIDNWENEGGHIAADNLSYKDGHLREKGKTQAVYAKNIVWDTDGEDPLALGLPDRLPIPEKVAEEGDDAISDYITQETGFCHKGFEIDKVARKERKPKIR